MFPPSIDTVCVHGSSRVTIKEVIYSPQSRWYNLVCANDDGETVCLRLFPHDGTKPILFTFEPHRPDPTVLNPNPTPLDTDLAT